MAEGVASITVTYANGSVILLSTLPGSASGNGLVWLETRDLDCGHPKNLKYIDMVEFHLDVPGSSLYFAYALKDRLTDEEEWSATKSLAGADQPVPIRVTTRYIRFRVSDFQPTTRWKLTNITLWGQVLDGDF